MVNVFKRLIHLRLTHTTQRRRKERYVRMVWKTHAITMMTVLMHSKRIGAHEEAWTGQRQSMCAEKSCPSQQTHVPTIQSYECWSMHTNARNPLMQKHDRMRKRLTTEHIQRNKDRREMNGGCENRIETMPMSQSIQNNKGRICFWAAKKCRTTAQRVEENELKQRARILQWTIVMRLNRERVVNECERCWSLSCHLIWAINMRCFGSTDEYL